MTNLIALLGKQASMTDFITPFRKTSPYGESHNPFQEKTSPYFYPILLYLFFTLPFFDESHNPFQEKKPPLTNLITPFWKKFHLVFLTNFRNLFRKNNH